VRARRRCAGRRVSLSAENRSLNDFFRVLTGRTPQLTPGVVEIFKHDWVYSSDKAVREVRYRVTPLEEGVTKTLEALHG